MKTWVYIIALCALCATVYAAHNVLAPDDSPAARLGSPYAIEREAARSELLAQGPAAFDLLAPLLGSENYRQRAIAAEIISEIATEKHADELIKLLAKYPDAPETTLPLLAAITRLNATQSASQIRSLLNTSSAEVRAAAVNALAKFGDTESAAKIAPLLRDDYGEVRLASAKALGTLNARGHGDEIYAALQNERAPAAKTAMIVALGDLQHAASGIYLVRLIDDETSPLFLPAVQALAKMQTDRARDALIELLMASEDFEMLGVAAKAVAAYGESAAGVLDAKIKTASTDDRRRILEAFEDMGPESIPHLIAFLETETYPLWQSRTDGVLRRKVKEYYNVDVDWELRHHDPPEKRDIAVKRWREWWEDFSKAKN